MIEELDLVALLTDLPARSLHRGDVGTVVTSTRAVPAMKSNL